MYERREVLKLSGSAIGTGIIGARISGSVKAEEKGERLGSSPFIEMFIEHEGAPEWPRTHTDDFPRYRIDNESGEVVFTPFVSEEMKQQAAREGVTISENALSFSTVSSTVFGGQSDPRIDGTQSLVTESEYENPEVSVRFQNGQAKVQTPDTQTSIGAGGREKVQLNSRTTTVRDREAGTKTVQSEKQEGTTEVPKMASGTRDVELTPTVRVINHGVVDFFAYGGEK